MYFRGSQLLGADSLQPALAMTAPNPPDDDALARALHRSRVLEDAPEALIQRSIDLFRARPRAAAAAVPAGLRHRLAAVLSVDSAGAVATGLRSGQGGGPAQTRQLLFTADGRDIDLRLQPASDGTHWRVSGQVLGPDLKGTATLLAGGYSAEVAWTDLAEFSFDQVPAGPCSLALYAPDWELVLPDFQTGEAG